MSSCMCSQGGQIGGGRLTCDTKKELYEKAKTYNIAGRSRMTKDQLIQAIRNHHAMVGEIIRKKRRRS